MARRKIDHVVHLMLENRSFDHMLGFLYPWSPQFEGLKGTESNTDGSETVPVFKLDMIFPSWAYYWPGTDPGEGLENYDDQMFGAGNAPTPVNALAPGYLANFAKTIESRRKNGETVYEFTRAQDIMGVFTSKMLPVLSGLAKNYAVCDQWFCSGPIHTWPNRAFAAAATSQGHIDNPPIPPPVPPAGAWLTAKTIFQALEKDMKQSWKIYCPHPPNSWTRPMFDFLLQADPSHFQGFDQLRRDAQNGHLPAYSFIEPDFGSKGDSQHPAYDVALGESLILDVYNWLSSNCEHWKKTLLIITYDEHGGLYDHFPPKVAATPPNDGCPGDSGFDFTRFGARVPAVLVSPLIKAGTVFRAGKDETIDHTSVIKTLFDLFKLEDPPLYLTDRDQAAASLLGVLNLDEARRDKPMEHVKAPPPTPPPPKFDPTIPSDLDRIYAWQIAQLPVLRDDGTVEAYTTDVPTTTDALRAFAFARAEAHQRYRASLAAKEESPPVNGGGTPAA